MLNTIEQLKSTAVVFAADPFSAKPNDELPGGNVLLKIVGGLMQYGNIIAVGAIVAGAMLWMFGSKSHNPGHATGGKTMLFVALGALVIIGAANELGSTANDLGKQVK